MYSLDDTIAAIGTPPGQGGIGIVRLSGPEAVSILRQVFQVTHGRDLLPRRITFGQVIDPATDEALDEALAFYIPGAPYPIPARTWPRSRDTAAQCRSSAF